MPGLNKLLNLICILSLLWGVTAIASDGVLEINQACAVNGGCFSGDTAGFPVTINQAGSYVLTGNLSPGTATAIAASEANDVAIDMNGFSINGSGTGAGIGISGGDGLTVKNGAIRSMGSHGINSSEFSRIENVLVLGNGSRGITVGVLSIIKNCIARNNGTDGIFGNTGTLVEGSNSSANGGDGIQLNTGIARNNMVISNDGDGIQISLGGLAIGNEVRFAGGSVLNLGATVGYAQNQLEGTVTGGLEVGTNVCNGNTVCP